MISEYSAQTSSFSLALLERSHCIGEAIRIFEFVLSLTGMIKARKVIEKAPMKLMKRPNRGTKIEKRAVHSTVTVRYKMLFN